MGFKYLTLVFAKEQGKLVFDHKNGSVATVHCENGVWSFRYVDGRTALLLGNALTQMEPGKVIPASSPTQEEIENAELNPLLLLMKYRKQILYGEELLDDLLQRVRRSRSPVVQEVVAT